MEDEEMKEWGEGGEVFVSRSAAKISYCVGTLLREISP